MNHKKKDFFIEGAPALFVFLWSTGFIGGKLGLPYAEPFTFLTLRFVLVITMITVIALTMKAPWPTRRMAFHLVVSGTLLHAGYIGGVFGALSWGLPAGIVALVVGLQPLLTAGFAFLWLRERLTWKQLAGFILGLAGVVLVLSNSLQQQETLSHQALLPGLALCILGLFSITLGTLYQKTFGSSMDLRTGPIVQYCAAALITGTLSLCFETGNIIWSGEFVFALFWLVGVLSIGAIMLLMILIKKGAANQTAKLFYLVPPTTAIIAHVVFGESLTIIMIIGMIITALGVYLARP
jgi:drug/metabolite transporter (DMT)-like permease